METPDFQFSAPERPDPRDSYPARKINGTVSALFKADGDDFVSHAVDQLELDFHGIVGDFHAGATRKSGAREPWYARGTEMRNERQISLLAADELAEISSRLDIPEIKPEWIGGNMVLEGLENFTRLPPRTLLFFEGGATLKIDGDNGPCRVAGRSIADQISGRDDIELAFAKEAKGLRGLVCWVEKPGVIKVGEKFVVHIPVQRIY